MRTQLWLNSVLPHGVGSSSESIAIEVIYALLLEEYGQNMYSIISINQIGEDLNEFILNEPNNKIHINLRYPAFEDFETKSESDKNLIRLNVVHSALLRIAERYKKLDNGKLEIIRDEILKKDFYFEFVRKTCINKKNIFLTGKLVIQPGMYQCNCYVVLENNEKEICRASIYQGLPAIAYDYINFFGICRWKGINEFILTGKLNEVETRITIDTCNVEIINLTPFIRPPQYTLMQANVSKVEREVAIRDYESCLHPESLALIHDARLRWSNLKNRF